MTTLYKNTRRIAATIMGTVILCGGTAIAMTRQAPHAVPAAAQAQAETIGRFVVTPQSVRFERHAETIGRFVVSEQRVVFVAPIAETKA